MIINKDNINDGWILSKAITIIDKEIVKTARKDQVEALRNDIIHKLFIGEAEIRNGVIWVWNNRQPDYEALNN